MGRRLGGFVATWALISVGVIAPWVAPPSAVAATGADWWHAVQVAADLTTSPPSVPVVILLGGSAARESTISDQSWAAEVAAKGGPAVLTYNLGSRNQTLEQDVALASALPQGIAGTFIGMNLGRFTAAPARLPIDTTPHPELAAKYSQHHHMGSTILSVERKRELARDWMARRYPVFKDRYRANLRQLERLIKVCKERDLHPVLLDLPRNMLIIRHAWDQPLGRYYRGCQALAEKYDIPFFRFMPGVHLLNTDFFDLAHLVQPGWPKWQGKLARQTVALLQPIYSASTSPGGGRGANGRTPRALLLLAAAAAAALGAGVTAKRRRGFASGARGCASHAAPDRLHEE